MATYLELAKAVALESGSFEPSVLTGVTNLSGRPAKIVHWVQRAYVNIQNSRRDWGWLFTTFAEPLIPFSAVYTPASLNLTRFATWATDRDWYQPVTLYDPAIGVSDEAALYGISHELWRTKWDRGDQTNYQRPTEYAISPRGEIEFGSIPDKAYVLRGVYQKGPQVLATANEVPEMPERFHDMIVWEAIRLMMLSDGDFQEVQFPTVEMVGLRHQLELDQLPEITIA